MLLTEEGRREIFTKFMALSNTWQKKKALVDVLTCWPPAKEKDTRSLHCEYLYALLTEGTDQYQALALIKLLLTQPLLEEYEVRWLCENASAQSVVNVIWIVLLNKCEHAKELILEMALQNKEPLKSHHVEDELIKKLLDSGFFIPLVPTALYTHMLQYMMNPNVADYNIGWAIEELKKSKYAAEAGQLHLSAIGVPDPLRGFTQSVLHFKKMLNK